MIAKRFDAAEERHFAYCGLAKSARARSNRKIRRDDVDALAKVASVMVTTII